MATHTSQTTLKKPFQVTRAKCGQCGKELRYVPFNLNNIMCRDCYGLDRYRRVSPAVAVVEKPIEVTITDEEATP
jgi:hypothetical protein